MSAILNNLGEFFMMWGFILGLSVGVKIWFAVILGFVAKRQKMKPFAWAFAGFMFDIWTVIAYVVTRLKIKKGNKNMDDGKVALWFTLIMACLVLAFGVAVSFT